MSEWTPGPWVFSPERDTHDSIIHAANAVEEHGYIDNDNGGVVGSSEWIWIKDADAHLIAAAPDLYEALEAAEDAIAEHLPGLEYLLDSVISPALAKARGEAQ